MQINQRGQFIIMAEGPLFVILDMIQLVLGNAVSTLIDLFGMAGRLLGSLLLVSAVGGTLGIVLAVIVLAVAGFFLAKFFMGSMRTIILLIVSVFLIMLFLLWGYSTL
jgi:hypothetical protein